LVLAASRPGGDDPHQQVALGEDAAQLLAVADQDAVAAMLGHLLGCCLHCVVGMADQRPVARDDLPYGPCGHGLDLPDADGSSWRCRGSASLDGTSRDCLAPAI
jgi:hypothetical protein